MTKEQAMKEIHALIEEHQERYEQIKKEAQENGTWCYWGLDSNQHLTKELYLEMKKRFGQIIRQIDRSQTE